jgi:hypothetical protein
VRRYGLPSISIGFPIPAKSSFLSRNMAIWRLKA